MNNAPVTESFSFPAFRVDQPIGEFYVGAIEAKRLCEITFVDVRRIKGEREFETYLGIQRRLDEKRSNEISQYVNTVDACFPTAVIIAVNGLCAKFDERKREMTLSPYVPLEQDEREIPYSEIAKVLDGQHRIEGLKKFAGKAFDINVCIFIDADIAEQAYLFTTVNLTQTKVNRSLAFDLFELARSRSPQKLCHNIAVALDGDKRSPFYQKIKRLGVATPGRYRETLTQATFVDALIPYLTRNEMADRDAYKRNKTPAKIDAAESERLIFRNMMIEERDTDIAEILMNYFSAVRDKWPSAWDATGAGMMLNRTNGFRALMRFLRDAYLFVVAPGEVPAKPKFVGVFQRIKIKDSEFNIDNFPPGTSGEVKLYNALVDGANLG
jgi:DGQHR domain-containing protein